MPVCAGQEYLKSLACKVALDQSLASEWGMTKRIGGCAHPLLLCSPTPRPMRISLNWLKALVPVTLPPEELGERLTMVGFEVEDIEDRRTWADGVVVGKVLTCAPHPNADKLRVCTVNIGADEPAQIVCGAPNVAAGLHVPVATVGTQLPSMGIKIKKAKLRGVPSHGMICSLTELGLETDIDGIHSFESDVQPGDDVRPLLGLDDVILDLTSTANRADALSMVGVAREVSALTGAEVNLPDIPKVNVPKGDQGVGVTLADPKACPAYIATVVENITVGPSPDWLKQRLLAAGTRPINNVVDITNYILLEWGQPLHAFDAHALPQKGDLALGIRFAQDGEELKTLDGGLRSLTPSSLVITAADRPVALAGIMGGEDSEVKDTTTTLVLEAALFDSLTVRRSARPHSLRTEASTRYERGVNEAQLDIACSHALKLLTELAGGEVTAQAIADHRTPVQRSIALRLDRINQILGAVRGLKGEPTTLQASEVTQILEVLGFSLTADDPDQVWTVAVPAHRYRDIEREIDLIEEIARLHGYDRFCETLPAKTEPGFLPRPEKFTQHLRQVMRGAGLTELLHYSWVKPSESADQSSAIEVVNPLLVEFSALRSELLTGLINAFAYNQGQGNGPLNGFELGRIFWREGKDLKEANAIAGILGGDPAQGKWTRGKDRDRPLSWFEAKGCLEQIFEQLNLSIEYRTDPGDDRLHPGRTASLWINDTACGRFGQLHPQLCQQRDLPEATYVFELAQDVLLQADVPTAVFQSYSTYPAVDRDLAFFIATDTPVQEIEQVIKKAAKGGQLLDSVELFDEYRGESVPEGQRSLAFRLIYRANDRTLTEEDVTPHSRTGPQGSD